MINKHYTTFLSYSHQDAIWVSQFVQSLKEFGPMFWSESDKILPGELWEETIKTSLRESTIFIVILSPNSITSNSVFFELGAAIADKKHIVPILISDIDARNLPYFLSKFPLFKEASPSKAGKLVAEVLQNMKSEGIL